jgi:Dimerisation domain/O-methyltransferase domain
MKPEHSHRPDTIERLATSVYASFAMLAGMQLDVFRPLKDGPLRADQLADALGIDPTRTARLLHALVAIGLLALQGNRFANTSEADHFLVRGRPTYIGMRYHAYRRRWQSMLQAAESIRTGTPQGRRDYAGMASDERESFYRGTYTEAVVAGRDLAARQDFARHRRLVDVGGGSGGLAIAMAEAWPHLSVTIAELPATIPVAQRYVDEAGVGDRVRVLPADVLSSPLSGCPFHLVESTARRNVHRPITNIMGLLASGMASGPRLYRIGDGEGSSGETSRRSFRPGQGLAGGSWLGCLVWVTPASLPRASRARRE